MGDFYSVTGQTTFFSFLNLDCPTFLCVCVLHTKKPMCFLLLLFYFLTSSDVWVCFVTPAFKGKAAWPEVLTHSPAPSLHLLTRKKGQVERWFQPLTWNLHCCRFWCLSRQSPGHSFCTMQSVLNKVSSLRPCLNEEEAGHWLGLRAGWHRQVCLGFAFAKGKLKWK